MVIDGEHYPPVVAAALAGLRRRYEVVGGLFAGGREKLRGGEAAAPRLAAELGLPRLDAVDPRDGAVAGSSTPSGPSSPGPAPRRWSTSPTSR